MKLEVEGLTAGYGRQPVLFDVSAGFPADGITAIIGPNGAGKSTLVKAVFRQAHTFAGRILLDGAEIQAWNPNRIVLGGLAYVPQLSNVFPTLSVRENLEIGTYVRRGGSLDAVLEIFPVLRDLLPKPAGKLSGGQRSMVAVGRALMSDPHVLLLDEATAGLSPLVAANLWEHLSKLAARGLAIVVVEQNVELAVQASSHVYLLASGRVRAEGPAAAFHDRREVEDMFLEASAAESGQSIRR